jgi:hypothetical protein
LDGTAHSNQELIERFSATTADLIPALGNWRYAGTLYEDVLLRIIVDAPGSFEADDFFRDYKQVLKKRFEQIDIWITSHEIHIF